MRSGGGRIRARLGVMDEVSLKLKRAEGHIRSLNWSMGEGKETKKLQEAEGWGLGRARNLEFKSVGECLLFNSSRKRGGRMENRKNLSWREAELLGPCTWGEQEHLGDLLKQKKIQQKNFSCGNGTRETQSNRVWKNAWRLESSRK